MYTASDLSKALGISRETVRQWSRQFADFLSATANPKEGNERRFTEADLRVIALIYATKQEGKTFADAKVALASGERAEFPEAARAALSSDTPSTIITAPARIASLQSEIVASNHLIAELRGRLEESDGLVAKKDGQIELLQAQLAEAKADIERLNREIGRMSK
jgi:DNA-binding transcriptional MerR regulator